MPWLSSSSRHQPGTLLPAPSNPFPTFFLLGAHISLQGLPVLGLVLSVWVTAFLCSIWWVLLVPGGQLPALE